jgi:hypothetical protein
MTVSVLCLTSQDVGWQKVLFASAAVLGTFRSAYEGGRGTRRIKESNEECEG